MRRFLETDPPSQLVELIAANDQLAGLAIDVAQAGLGGDDSVEAARLYRVDETALTSW